MTQVTINTGKVNSYIVQKTIGGWVVCWLNEDRSIRSVDGGKVHKSRQNAYAKAKRLNDAHGYVTLLSEQAPRPNQSAAQRWGSSTDGTEMVVWKKSDGWYGCLRGIHQGSAFESEDDGPYPSRDVAEMTMRAYYADSQAPIEPIYPDED